MISIADLNRNIFLDIYNFSHHNSILDFLMVFGAEHLIFIMLLIVLFLFLKNKNSKQNVFHIIISLTIGIISIRLLHIFFYEPRPFLSLQIIPLVYQPIDGSFPSMHTAILTILAFSFIKTKTKYGHMMLIPVIWTGFARIYTGVHYPIDILGGVIVGVLSVSIAARFFQKVKSS